MTSRQLTNRGRIGNFMKQDVSQAKILAQVDALVTRHKGRQSLWEVGYTHVGIDDGWQACGTGFNGSFHDVHGKRQRLTRPKRQAGGCEAPRNDYWL